MATMTDVANVAGCSTTTVSHVLNGTRTVAAQTRRQVERAIEQDGYQRRITRPGHAPRHLSAVGLTSSPLGGNPYFGEVVQGVEQELARAGRVLVVADTHDCPETERRAVASLLGHRVEAFVMVPTANWQERSWPLLAERCSPFVLMDRMIEGDFDQIGVENEPGSRKLVEHLLAIGHRKVGMITGLLRPVNHRRAEARLSAGAPAAPGRDAPVADRVWRVQRGRRQAGDAAAAGPGGGADRSVRREQRDDGRCADRAGGAADPGAVRHGDRRVRRLRVVQADPTRAYGGCAAVPRDRRACWCSCC